jgi:hypothetical protein
MLFYIIMALNCLVNTIKCTTVFMLQLCLLWKMSMSHMTSLQLQMLKPPHLPCKQNWIPKKKTTTCESVKSMVALYKSGTN